MQFCVLGGYNSGIMSYLRVGQQRAVQENKSKVNTGCDLQNSWLGFILIKNTLFILILRFL